MTGDHAALDKGERRHLLRATRHGVRAAWMEVAAAGRVERARNLALEHHFLAPLVRMARQGRGEQGLRVGMQRMVGELSLIHI